MARTPGKSRRREYKNEREMVEHIISIVRRSPLELIIKSRTDPNFADMMVTHDYLGLRRRIAIAVKFEIEEPDIERFVRELANSVRREYQRVDELWIVTDAPAKQVITQEGTRPITRAMDIEEFEEIIFGLSPHPANVKTPKSELSSSQLEMYCFSLLEREGWKVVRQGPGIGLDAIAKLHHFSIGLECRTQITNAARLLNQLHGVYNRHSTGANRLDEIWAVAPNVTDTARDLFGALEKQVSVYSLEEFEDMLRRGGYEPKTRTRWMKAKTKIGRAALLNQNEIVALATSLTTIIDERLASLNDTRLNDPNSIAKANASADELRRLRAQVQTLAASVAAFKKGTAKEKEVVASVKTLGDGLQAWWSKDYMTICGSGFTTALFTGAVTVCSLAGVSVHGKTVAIIAGALAGGKPLIEAMKGLKGIWK